ncbi:Peptidyl-prolyl cis-trans isomerase D (PPIase D) (Cyclophilin D) (Rotamase D) [Durusdinium trenchii]|uniref:Peptidyl-prolyl cis-trans isomerase D (PPIase D) (Cyclophilin D) (Rotamase D) n=1 Tax=Durusdinium trenchii TaxID=1381693 RepID=A0ABP0SA15_9DINO
MKRRVNNLASSTAKKRAWREEPAEEEAVAAGDLPGGPLPDSDDEKPPPPKDPPPGTQIRTGSPNPVVWMEVAVADKSRGRLHFELFQDLAPQASESFRKLCVGHTEDSGATVTYAQTAIDLVYAGRYITAGDIDASLSFEGIDRSGELTHQKAGLLTMPCGSASLFDPRFQITLGTMESSWSSGSF